MLTPAEKKRNFSGTERKEMQIFRFCFIAQPNRLFCLVLAAFFFAISTSAKNSSENERKPEKILADHLHLHVAFYRSDTCKSRAGSEKKNC